MRYRKIRLAGAAKRQKDINVVINDEHGVFLVYNEEEGRRSEKLADSMEDAYQTADHAKMLKLHARLTEELVVFSTEHLTELLNVRSRELEEVRGLTSPEYKRWERMRVQLRTLVQ